MFYLAHCSKSPEPVQLEECLPECILSTTTSIGEGVKTNGTVVAENTYHEKNAYAINLLISPTIVPLLHELAQRLVTSDHHQQCCKIYKYVNVNCKRNMSSLRRDHHLFYFFLPLERKSVFAQ